MTEMHPAEVAHFLKQLVPQAANHSVPVGETSSLAERLDPKTAFARQIKAARMLLAWDQATLAKPRQLAAWRERLAARILRERAAVSAQRGAHLMQLEAAEDREVGCGPETGRNFARRRRSVPAARRP
jgi:hypothetical protein